MQTNYRLLKLRYAKTTKFAKSKDRKGIYENQPGNEHQLLRTKSVSNDSETKQRKGAR
jgi:hypothetical protein